jgi:adenosylcobinamide-phosphate synthase
VNALAWQLLGGAALDLAIGGPRWLPHPVRGFGFLAVRLEKLWRRAPLSPRLAGCGFWLCSVGAGAAAVWITLPWAAVYWIYSLLALRDLDFEATLVLRHLERGDLDAARRSLAMIVGRDTAALDESEILRAAIETVSENLSDAVIAPLFYCAIFGPIGMAAYKAINTLDSMCGYKNERYREFGWASARMDDLANLVPSRLSALLVWCCALLPGFSLGRSVRATLRDAAKQPSPNSGYPEAAFAGALGIRLGGLNYYRGVPTSKHYIGEAERPFNREAFRGARVLLYASSMLMLAVVCVVLA